MAKKKRPAANLLTGKAWGQVDDAEGGVSWLTLKGDGDTTQFIPLTAPAAFEKEARGKSKDKRQMFRFAVLDMADKSVKVRDSGVKEAKKLRGQFSETWGSRVLQITRNGVKDSTATFYVFEDIGEAAKAKLPASLEALQLEGAQLVKASLE